MTILAMPRRMWRNDGRKRPISTTHSDVRHGGTANDMTAARRRSHQARQPQRYANAVQLAADAAACGPAACDVTPMPGMESSPMSLDCLCLAILPARNSANSAG